MPTIAANHSSIDDQADDFTRPWVEDTETLWLLDPPGERLAALKAFLARLDERSA